MDGITSLLSAVILLTTRIRLIDRNASGIQSIHPKFPQLMSEKRKVAHEAEGYGGWM